MTPLESLIATGTKIWLDSIDPDLVVRNRAWGASGATSNPIIIADLIKTGRFDDQLLPMMARGVTDADIAWELTDLLVTEAQHIFMPVWQQTRGDDGYVSFELDPLLEDPQAGPPHAQRVARYVELGTDWAAGHQNRMIKVPATPAGIEAMETLAAAGVTINVTLIFTQRQYLAARQSIWQGAQRRAAGLANFKSVYSIFISRIDVYTQEHYSSLNPAAQGQAGILNAKRLWTLNQAFWADKGLRLKQEIIFASTGAKLANDAPDKYVEALAGSDIQTNPPATNEAVQKSGKTFVSHVAQMPPGDVVAEIDRVVDMDQLERDLMAEGLRKFADPQKKLLELIAQKRQTLAPAEKQ